MQRQRTPHATARRDLTAGIAWRMPMHTRLGLPGLLPTLVLLVGACAGSSAPSPQPAPATATPATTAPAPAPAAPAATAQIGSSTVPLPPRPDRPVARVTIGYLNTLSDVVFFLPEEK